MRNQSRVPATLIALGSFLLAACGDSGSTTSSEVSPSEASVASSDDSATTTTAAAVTAPPTTLPDPTIFNPNRIGDLTQLTSFVVTVEEFHSSNGQPSQRTITTGYTKDPNNAYVINDFHDGSTSQEYLVDGRTYQNNNQGYWYLYERGSLAAPDLLYGLSDYQAIYGVSTAVFAVEEDFAGVPAYHFKFDETNLQSFSSYTPANPSPVVTGDFYLAKEGNYLLFAHSRMVAAGAGYELIDEYTQTLSSVNQLAAITLPADLLPLKEALDLGLTLGIPMPADGALDSMINYNSGGIGVYYYQYTSAWANQTEFLDFYRNLPPTNGWTVAHIGQVENLDVHCFEGNCVIINNGDKQFILYFDGSNLHADYDREHRFSAL